MQCNSKRRSFTQHCSGKRPSFATTLLSKLPSFTRVYVFVVLSVPRLTCKSLPPLSFLLVHVVCDRLNVRTLDEWRRRIICTSRRILSKSPSRLPVGRWTHVSSVATWPASLRPGRREPDGAGPCTPKVQPTTSRVQRRSSRLQQSSPRLQPDCSQDDGPCSLAAVQTLTFHRGATPGGPRWMARSRGLGAGGGGLLASTAAVVAGGGSQDKREGGHKRNFDLVASTKRKVILPQITSY